MKKYFTLAALLVFGFIGFSAKAQLEIRLVAGQLDTVRTAQHYYRGMTEPNSQLTVNGTPFTVFNTGAFAAQVQLKEGNNKVVFVARHNGKETVSEVSVYYQPPQKPQATSRFEIESLELLPEVSMVYPGDVIRVRAKAFPGSKLTWIGGKELVELPAGEADGLEGVYQAQYVVKENDPLLGSPITVTMTNGSNTTSKELSKGIKVADPTNPLYVKSKGNFPYLNYGLGQDRLGGAKMGYITAGIDMKVIGKVRNLYKVQLAKHYTAWIPESEVEEPVASAYFRDDVLTSSWHVSGDDRFDYVRIGLSGRKLPYRSFQEVNPSRIVLDIFGATANTSWITQLTTAKEVANVTYEQVEDDIFRVFIDLKHRQNWGYSVYYEGSKLVVRVKHRPKQQLKGLRIALDAGHGGTSGAIGTTGLDEKDVNLELVYLLKAELEKRGAHIILTREKDTAISMADRLLFLREQSPDLLLSIHNNAGGNPLTTKGTSTYYYHIGFRPLSVAILDKLLQLNVSNFGNIGSFNFALNSPTEYPNALVEVLFMSSPEDEAKLLDKEFKLKVARKIAEGVSDFVAQSS